MNTLWGHNAQGDNEADAVGPRRIPAPTDHEASEDERIRTAPLISISRCVEHDVGGIIDRDRRRQYGTNRLGSPRGHENIYDGTAVTV